jgi:hypothetical protein
MGEAKRRNAQGRQLAEGLSRRLRAGEFGPPGAAGRYLIVLDKSPNGRDTLAALRTRPELEGLPILLEAEPLRLWEASALFGFLVLIGGEGKPEQRSFLAADADRLVQNALPRARLRLKASDGPVGEVCGVDGSVRGAIEAALRSLRR